MVQARAGSVGRAALVCIRSAPSGRPRPRADRLHARPVPAKGLGDAGAALPLDVGHDGVLWLPSKIGRVGVEEEEGRKEEGRGDGEGDGGITCSARLPVKKRRQHPKRGS